MAWPDAPDWRPTLLWREGALTPRAEVEECRRQLGQQPYAALWAALATLDPDDWVTALDEATE